MNYTLHQLHVFTKVVQLKSVTRASEELHMTQPAVSIQLKNFQDQFDIPLTEVVGRKLYVTEFGKEVYTMALNIINEVNAINFKTMSYKGHLAGRLTISIVSTGQYVMPFFLAGFMSTMPGIELEMDVTNKSRVVESLQNNEIDFALVSVLPDEFKVNQEVLLDNELYVVANAAYKPAAKVLGKKELSELPMIFREVGSGTLLVLEEYFKRNKLQVRKKMALTSNEAVKQAVIAGLGTSVMPLIGIKKELMASELKILPALGFPIKTRWRLIWLKEKKLSPIAEAFLEYLRENKAAVIEKHFSWLTKMPAQKQRRKM